jgi:hypothetical protein
LYDSLEKNSLEKCQPNKKGKKMSQKFEAQQGILAQEEMMIHREMFGPTRKVV